MWAGVRRNSSREFLQEKRIKFIELDLSSPEALDRAMSTFIADNRRWDYIIHAAGATKCIDKNDFMRINFEGTKNLIEALKRNNIFLTAVLFKSLIFIRGTFLERKYPSVEDGNMMCAFRENLILAVKVTLSL